MFLRKHITLVTSEEPPCLIVGMLKLLMRYEPEKSLIHGAFTVFKYLQTNVKHQ